ncbi:peptide N-acetyl-beta-D-glucosaminyl asparaginase amidase A-domain-containing protein [Geopyxis carbonaria]|nr:peptide N-acetyl-beta-D-glucosaminyl asparaginase amidase A-domain-containing protein [Geopyxis carbonaria]
MCTQPFWRLRHASYCASVSTSLTPFSGGPAPASEPLTVFSVDRPLRVPSRAPPSAANCTQEILHHTFAYSYTHPFVGNYTPPACAWTNILFTMTTTSQGRQYDRLAHLFLGDTEVWRTSTAEPTDAGIIFSATKDMTRYAALLREPQTVIMELGNLVNDALTGAFDVTLTATYYSPAPVNPTHTAAAVLPISARRSSQGQPSHWRLPADGPARSTLTIPRNTSRAILSVSATGSEAEEFWYSNVPSSYTQTWANTTLYGGTAFREVQVLLDGALAGVAWPAVTIYTGGVAPSLWRPIVDIDAFELPEYEVDLTPWLGLIADGAPHTVEIAVAAFDDATRKLTPATGDAWLVSARVFLWPGASPASPGVRPKVSAPPPVAHYTPPTLDAANSSLSYALRVSRTLSVVAGDAAWVQNLDYTFTTTLTAEGNTQNLSTTTSTNDATRGAARRRQGSLEIDMALDTAAGVITAQVEHGLGVYGVNAFSAAGGARGNDDAVFKGNATWVLAKGGEGTVGVERRWRGTRENKEGVEAWEREVEAWCGFNGAAGVGRDVEVVDGVEVGA